MESTDCSAANAAMDAGDGYERTRPRADTHSPERTLSFVALLFYIARFRSRLDSYAGAEVDGAEVEGSLENERGAAYQQYDADDRPKRLLTQVGVNVTADVQPCQHNGQACHHD